MEAAKERRSSSLLPPLSYETFDTFFEAKKTTKQHAHTNNIYSYAQHIQTCTYDKYLQKTHIQLNTHIKIYVQRCRYAKCRYLR